MTFLGFLFRVIFIVGISFFTIGVRHGFSQNGDASSFCQNFKTLVESARSGFESIKGADTIRVITGSPKKFFISNINFNDSIIGYVNDVTSYPEYECVLAKDVSISDQLTGSYDRYKLALLDCFLDGWTIIEQDSTNNFYLKGTKFKKMVAIEKTEGKKIKFHLYMYSNMIEKKRIVEVKIEGIGKQN